MKIYLFFLESCFYPVEFRDDADAVANVIHNIGTVKVETVDGELIWPKPEHKQ